MPLPMNPKGLNLLRQRTLRSLSGLQGFIFGCIGGRTRWISTSSRWNSIRSWRMKRSLRRTRIPSCRLTSWLLKRLSRSNGTRRDWTNSKPTIGGPSSFCLSSLQLSSSTCKRGNKANLTVMIKPKDHLSRKTRRSLCRKQKQRSNWSQLSLRNEINGWTSDF